MKKILLLLLVIFSLIAFTANAEQPRQIADDATQKIIKSVMSALKKNGIEGKLQVSLNGNGFKLRDEVESYIIEVNDLRINEKAQIFRGDLAITSADNKTMHSNISGSYDILTSVPVLKKNLSPNTVVSEADIDWMEFPSNQVKFGTITKPEDIIGKQVKGIVSLNSPIKGRDLQKEQVISRNANINILFQTAAISIMATGTALDNGGVGDVIRVKNNNSNKIIKAEIIDEQNVAAISSSNNLTKNSVNDVAENKGGNYVR